MVFMKKISMIRVVKNIMMRARKYLWEDPKERNTETIMPNNVKKIKIPPQNTPLKVTCPGKVRYFFLVEAVSLE
jgi:hypothetical protein